MKAKTIFTSAVCAVVIFVAFNIVKGLMAGEEGQVRKFVYQGKVAVESKNLLKLSDMISFDYRDSYGYDRSSFIYILRETFRYYEKFFITIDDIQIQFGETEQNAEVEVTVLIIGKVKERRENIFEGEKGDFKIDLKKEDGKWKLLKFKFYEPVTIMGHYIT